MLEMAEGYLTLHLPDLRFVWVRFDSDSVFCVSGLFHLLPPRFFRATRPRSTGCSAVRVCVYTLTLRVCVPGFAVTPPYRFIRDISSVCTAAYCDIFTGTRLPAAPFYAVVLPFVCCSRCLRFAGYRSFLHVLRRAILFWTFRLL